MTAHGRRGVALVGAGFKPAPTIWMGIAAAATPPRNDNVHVRPRAVGLRPLPLPPPTRGGGGHPPYGLWPILDSMCESTSVSATLMITSTRIAAYVPVASNTPE